MKRFAEKYLICWKDRENRKPLILRGARQTGKTYLIEQFAKDHFERFLKVDFEFDMAARAFFENPDPKKITSELSLYFNTEITEGSTLLFLDEIQVCPKAIASLRYFYEKMPTLHVIAAGSLLDFVLRDFPYSMPVGRIEFLYLYPLTFEEFLWEYNPKLSDYIRNVSLKEDINDAIHEKLTELLRIFFFTGGMPEAADSYLKNHDFLDVQRIQNAIVTTMQNDFAKYGMRIQQEYLRQVMHFVPRNIGKKIKYTHIDREVRSNVFKEAFHQLSLSKVIHLVCRSSGNGLPLDAEVSVNSFKSLFLDIGLVNHICGLKLTDPNDLITVYEGGLAEQFAGQELLNLNDDYDFQEARLYYWSREEKNSNAEIDYLMAHHNQVIPIEIKAGKTGSLKSLHLFLYEKKGQIGLRFNMDKPSVGKFDASVRFRKEEGCLEYILLSLPLYLIGQSKRLLMETPSVV